MRSSAIGGHRPSRANRALRKARTKARRFFRNNASSTFHLQRHGGTNTHMNPFSYRYSNYPQQAIDYTYPGLPSGTQTYSPYAFGHPHEQAQPQATDPFWWQYPSWTFSDQQLYFYPGIGFSDRPLYMDHTMDGEPVIIGYGSRFSGKQTNGPKSSARPHILKMVSVYNGDDFVQKIPFKLLLRFSHAAREAFPKPVHNNAAQGPTHTAAKQTEQSSVSTPVADDGRSPSTARTTNWADEVESTVSGKDGAAASSTKSVRQSSRETAPTEFTQSEPLRVVSSGRIQSIAPVFRPVPRDANGNKMLKLDLPVKEMPSNQAIQDVLKWVRDNENEPRDGNLTYEYAPPDLDKFELETLVDFYQAALAFSMLPFPRRLRAALFDRITNLDRLDFETFRDLAGWIPAQDSVMKRIINVFENFRSKGAYKPQDLQKFEDLLSQPSNEELKAKVEEIRNARFGRNRNSSGNPERYGETRQRDWEKKSQRMQHSTPAPSKTPSPAAAIREKSPAASAKNDADDLKPRRRRPRRQQQQQQGSQGNGRGQEGRHVPGAD